MGLLDELGFSGKSPDTNYGLLGEPERHAFSSEQQKAPYGVIKYGNKIFVGSPHGSEIPLSKGLLNEIQHAAKNKRVFFEGNGGDIEPNSKIFGNKENYAGSWDDGFAKNIKGYPSDFLYTLFTNVSDNKQDQHLVNVKKNIFDSILNAQSKVGFFKDRKFDQNTLNDFLSRASDENIDFVKLSKLQATPENVKEFLRFGENAMWPENWQDYPNNAGKMAQRAENMRNQYLMQQPAGVYVMGAGHLNEIKQMNPFVQIIGGEKAGE